MIKLHGMKNINISILVPWMRVIVPFAGKIVPSAGKMSMKVKKKDLKWILFAVKVLGDRLD
jgi:hypothetical protein